MLQTQINHLRSQKPLVLAWSVHLLTASGAVWGLMAILATMQHEWKQAFFWMIAAVFVDGLDGTLARKFKVKGQTPDFDGALLDNIVDYETYVVVPALFLYEAGLLPSTVAVLGTALVLLSSAFQFCQADAKTEDHTFKGFPSYWNVVVFYLFLFDFPLWFNFASIVTLVILVFIPIKYLYPSRMVRFRRPTLIITTLWAILVTAVLFQYPNQSRPLLWLSMLYPLYYFGLSMYIMLDSKPSVRR